MPALAVLGFYSATSVAAAWPSLGLTPKCLASVFVEVLLLEDPPVGNSYRGLLHEPRRDRVMDPVLAYAEHLANVFDEPHHAARAVVIGNSLGRKCAADNARSTRAPTRCHGKACKSDGKKDQSGGRPPEGQKKVEGQKVKSQKLSSVAAMPSNIADRRPEYNSALRGLFRSSFAVAEAQDCLERFILK